MGEISTEANLIYNEVVLPALSAGFARAFSDKWQDLDKLHYLQRIQEFLDSYAIKQEKNLWATCR